MLRGRTLSRALVLAAVLQWASPATAANPTIGGACTTGDSAAATTGDGNNVVCIGSVWQYPAYQLGASTASCNATNAGIVRYNSGSLQYCNSSAWQTISSSGNGAMILISTQTASNSATLQWTGLSTYNIYKLYCYGLNAVNDANTLVAQFGTGAGPTWSTTNYNGRVDTAQSLGGALAEYAATGTRIDLSNTNISNETDADGYIDATLYNLPNTTGINKEMLFHNSYRPYDGSHGAETVIGEGYDWGDQSVAVTAIKLYYTSGNINSGTCSLYGVNN
jgi:hypothetical protein